MADIIDKINDAITIDYNATGAQRDQADEDIRFVEVLLVNDGSSTKVGAPFVDGATVTAKVVDQFRGPKGVAFKFKRRKGNHKTKGFRRSLTKLEITGIAG